MEITKYLEQKNNLIAGNRLLKFTVIVLGFGLVLNAFITYSLSKCARTIVVPPVINTKCELSGYRLSDEYVKLMTRYIMGLAANYNPSTARNNFDELLSLYDPDAATEGRKTFYKLADTVETAHVTASFFIHKILIDEGKQQILVEGQKRLSANEQKVEQGEAGYVIDYANNNGRFSIVRLSQKAKGRQEP